MARDYTYKVLKALQDCPEDLMGNQANPRNFAGLKSQEHSEKNNPNAINTISGWDSELKIIPK